jgi:hypothetical protein
MKIAYVTLFDATDVKNGSGTDLIFGKLGSTGLQD